MNRKLILFDLDDTLVVEWEAAKASFLHVANIVQEKHGINSATFPAAALQHCNKLWQNHPCYTFCEKIGISSWEGLWSDFSGSLPELKMLAKWGQEFQFNTWNNTLLQYEIDDTELASSLSKAFQQKRNSLQHIFPETHEVLKQLSKTYALGMITNGTPDIQWAKINGCKIGGYFGQILISGELGIYKPSQEIYQRALNYFQVQPEETIMIGDSLTSDIQGAQNAGITALWINRTDRQLPSDFRPDGVIDNLNQIANFI